MSSEPEAKRAEYIYLIGAEQFTLVKIGWTIDAAARLAKIQTMSPAKLAILWQTEGGVEVETALHRHFKGRRSHGEWFDFPDGDAVQQVERAIVAVKKARKAEKVWRAGSPRFPRVRAAHPTSRIGRRYAEVCRPKPQPEYEPFTIKRAPAVYRQVADVIRGEIESGVYPFGSRLPSSAKLAEDLGVKPSSIAQALALLRQDGLISSRHRGGSTVIYRGEVDQPLPETG